MALRPDFFAKLAIWMRPKRRRLSLEFGERVRTYSEDIYIPEIQGKAHGAITLVFDNPYDLRKVISAVSPIDDFEKDYNEKYKADERDQSQPDIREFLRKYVAAPDQNPKGTGSRTDAKSRSQSAQSPSGYLSGSRHNESCLDILRGCQELWFSRKQEIGDLRLIIALPNTVDETISIQNKTPILGLYPGSIVAQVLAGSGRVSVFLAGLVLGGGVSASHRALSLSRRLRENAMQSYSLNVLKDLRELQDDEVAGYVLVVFVHGLLSTDVGLFDRLVAMVERVPGIVPAAFPHNTLASIHESGKALAREIARLDAAARVIFVCHSRGGLVARTAAQFLYDRDPDWEERLSGCVTFGTPHRGAELAEAPALFAGVFALMSARSRGQACASVVDILAIWTQYRSFPGIEDLRPPDRGNTFLSRLEDREGLFPKLDILAIGGDAPVDCLAARISARALGTTHSDLVVTLDSSLPSFCRQDRRFRTSCNHFEYFDEDQQDALAEAENYIRAKAAQHASK